MLVTKVVSILMIPHLIYGLSRLTAEIISYDQEFCPDYYKLMTVKLVNDTGRLVLNGSVIYGKEITQFDLRLKMIATERLGARTWTLVDIKTDGCKLLGSGRQRKLNLVHLMLSNMATFGDIFPKKCPIPKDVEYSIVNFSVDEDKFPPLFPDITLNVIFEYMDGQIMYYRANMKILIEPRNKQKTKRRGKIN